MRKAPVSDHRGFFVYKRLGSVNLSRPTENSTEYEYDVALSFAGEDRTFVETVANELAECDVRVFYDEFQKAELWGKDLFQHLASIYRDKAKFCIIFVSN